jgi:recombinational DNA repair ATPase RecF
MLKRIATQDVEPADLDVTLAPRLNLLAGDNGLGKTFLLDLAWWALTSTWARRAAIPRRREDVSPKIHCEIEDAHGSTSIHGSFIFHEQHWSREEPSRRSTIDHKTGRPVSRLEYENMKLVIGAGPEGGFEVWDSYRTSGPWRLPLGGGPRTA